MMLQRMFSPSVRAIGSWVSTVGCNQFDFTYDVFVEFSKKFRWNP